MANCKKCFRPLEKWSKFRDMQMKDGSILAGMDSFFNGIGHMFMGNSGYRTDCDGWSSDLFYCTNCKKYHMVCSKCGKFIVVDGMPKNGKTVATCSSCGYRTLYAADYDMGGG